jgi:hypothetical protein
MAPNIWAITRKTASASALILFAASGGARSIGCNPQGQHGMLMPIRADYPF